MLHATILRKIRAAHARTDKLRKPIQLPIMLMIPLQTFSIVFNRLDRSTCSVQIVLTRKIWVVSSAIFKRKSIILETAPRPHRTTFDGALFHKVCKNSVAWFQTTAFPRYQRLMLSEGWWARVLSVKPYMLANKRGTVTIIGAGC